MSWSYENVRVLDTREDEEQESSGRQTIAFETLHVLRVSSGGQLV